MVDHKTISGMCAIKVMNPEKTPCCQFVCVLLFFPCRPFKLYHYLLMPAAFAAARWVIPRDSRTARIRRPTATASRLTLMPAPSSYYGN